LGESGRRDPWTAWRLGVGFGPDSRTSALEVERELGRLPGDTLHDLTVCSGRLLLPRMPTVPYDPAPADHHVPHRCVLTAKNPRIQNLVAHPTEERRVVLIEHDDIRARAGFERTQGAGACPRSTRVPGRQQGAAGRAVGSTRRVSRWPY